MFVCEVCGVKLFSTKIREQHFKKRHPETPMMVEPIEETKVVVEATESPFEPAVLNFTAPVEIQINNSRYSGRTITVPIKEHVAEILRIAREAYGESILGG